MLWRISGAGRWPRMPARCCWARPTARSVCGPVRGLLFGRSRGGSGCARWGDAGPVQVGLLALAEQSLVGLELDEERVPAVGRDCEEVGLAGTPGLRLLEWGVRNDPGIDSHAVRPQVAVEPARQERCKHRIGAQLQPVGGKMPPSVEKVEEVGAGGACHGLLPVVGGSPAQDRAPRVGICRWCSCVYYRPHVGKLSKR